jgi:hypothetical protein
MSQKASQSAIMLILRTCNLLKGLVGAPGFEPGTSCAQGRRATRLRYAPIIKSATILPQIICACQRILRGSGRRSLTNLFKKRHYRMSTMTMQVFFSRRQFRKSLSKLRKEEDRIISKTVRSPWLFSDGSQAFPPRF